MAMRALLWSFGGAEQDEAGNVAINSKETIEALKYMKALYQESETAEVFTWTPPSNNQAMLAGRVSFVMNAISIDRKSTHLNSSHGYISYAVFCLKKKNNRSGRRVGRLIRRTQPRSINGGNGPGPTGRR